MEQRRWCGAGERRIAATSRHSAPRLSDIGHGELHTSPATRPRESRILLPKHRVVSRKTTTIRKSKATRRRSTTRRAVKREAAMPEIAEPYRDDIAISRRSQSCGVEDSKPTNIRKSEPTKESPTMEKAPEAH